MLCALPFASINCLTLSASVELKETIRRNPAVSAALEEVGLASQATYPLRAGLSQASPRGSAALLACARASTPDMTKLLKEPFFFLARKEKPAVVA